MPRGPLDDLDDETTGPVPVKLADGSTVMVHPLPDRLVQAIQRRFEIPDPPTKTIDTIAGPEQVPDPQNPEYQAEVRRITEERQEVMAKVLIHYCLPDYDPPPDGEWLSEVRMWLPDYEPPEDAIERKADWLHFCKIRTSRDWMMIEAAAQMATMITPKEVAAELRRFRAAVSEQAADIFASAIGSPELFDEIRAEIGREMAQPDLGGMAEAEPGGEDNPPGGETS